MVVALAAVLPAAPTASAQLAPDPAPGGAPVSPDPAPGSGGSPPPGTGGTSRQEVQQQPSVAAPTPQTTITPQVDRSGSSASSTAPPPSPDVRQSQSPAAGRSRGEQRRRPSRRPREKRRAEPAPTKPERSVFEATSTVNSALADPSNPNGTLLPAAGGLLMLILAGASMLTLTAQLPRAGGP
jgi:hypothetical protein